MTTTLTTDTHRLLAAELKELQAENDRLKAIITAARKRCGDAKAIHSRFQHCPRYELEKMAPDALNQMEHIVYSIACYLDGIPGQYLEKEAAA